MASVALGFVGTVAGGLIGGPFGAQIGGMIGVSLGGMIDNELFPQKQQGPRLTDLAVQVSTYGQMIPLLFGPDNRMAGNVIYSSGLIETEHKDKAGGKGGPSVEVTSYTYSTNLAVALCDAQRKPISKVRKVWANSKLIYSAEGESGSVAPDPLSAKVWSEFRFYDGSFSQMPDSLLEGAIGVGEVPAYRGTSYCVIWGLQLADYGNRLPNLEFLVEADEEVGADAVLSYIVEVCGMDPNTVSQLWKADNVRGYQIGVASSGTGAIQPLALAYDFDTAIVGGALRFTARGAGLQGVVPKNFLAGHQGGETRPELIHWSHAPETQLPQQATLSFADPDRDWQVNAQVARRAAGTAQNNLSSQIPVVLTVDQAAKVVDRLLWEAWNTRSSATAVGDDRLIDLQGGKVYLFDTPAGLEPLRVKHKQRGANGVINLDLVRDRSEVYKSTRAGVPSAVLPNEVVEPGPVTLFLIDGPILADSDDDTGFYYVIDGTTGFRGAEIMRSIDGSASFTTIGGAGFQTVMGTAEHLAAGVVDLIDNVNVLRVQLDADDDALTSCTLEAMLSGANAVWLGPIDGQDGEILQFMFADLVSPGYYELSGLLRGRLGTEHAVDGHGTGDRFVLLDANSMYRSDFGPSDWNKDRAYKCVPLLTLEADADPQDFTNTGEGKRPLSPVHIVGVTDPVTMDTAVTWVRRSRLRQPGLGNGLVPLGEAVEAYQIDVFDGPDVVRTISSATPSFTYTAAMRSADGGGTKEIQVFQISDVRGRGRPGIAEI